MATEPAGEPLPTGASAKSTTTNEATDEFLSTMQRSAVTHVRDLNMLPTKSESVPTISTSSIQSHGSNSPPTSSAGGGMNEQSLATQRRHMTSTDIGKYPVFTVQTIGTEPLGWKPSLLRVGPLVGLAALLFSGLSIAASYAVLKSSHGDAVVNWRYQPTVYLAILTAVSNKALGFAVVQGAVTTWWIKALDGTTLQQMHRDWGYGLFVYRALGSGRHFNLLALACICGTFVAMDGPLLQRASSVKLEVPQQSVTLGVAITPEIPAYFSGWSMYDIYPEIALDFTTEFIPIVHEHSDHAPITGITGCEGTCSAKVRAPGLQLWNCDSTIHHKNYSKPLSAEDEKLFKIGKVAPEDRAVFALGFGSVNGTTTEGLLFSSTLSDESVTKSCVGNQNVTVCYLLSAIAEYDVVITNGTISFPEPPSYPKIIEWANNTAINNETIAQYGLRYDAGSSWIRSTLSGVAEIGAYEFGTTVGLAPSPSAGDTPILALGGSQSWFAWKHITNFKAWDLSEQCAPAWKNPRDNVLAVLNEVMFRTGVYTAKHYNETYLKSRIDDGLEIHYNVTGTPLSQIEVFDSDFAYFAGAAAVELFCILAILFTFSGFWKLGRHMSFSPLEIAKAFDAPLLQADPSNKSGRHLAKLEGDRAVQYGIFNFPDIERLAVAEQGSVRHVTTGNASVKAYYEVLRAFVVQRFAVTGHRRQTH